MTDATPWIKGHGQPAPLARMKAARIGLSMTQAAAGQLIGKSPSHFAKIERGEIGLSATEALTLCKALDLNLAALLSVNA